MVIRPAAALCHGMVTTNMETTMIGVPNSQPYCDTMYHTRFYHQKNPMDVQVSIVV